MRRDGISRGGFPCADGVIAGTMVQVRGVETESMRESGWQNEWERYKSARLKKTGFEQALFDASVGVYKPSANPGRSTSIRTKGGKTLQKIQVFTDDVYATEYAAKLQLVMQDDETSTYRAHTSSKSSKFKSAFRSKEISAVAENCGSIRCEMPPQSS